jgi:DNA-binding NarL/FixJ family response regulator
MPADSASPIRILLVDDHVLMRAGLRMLIENQPELLVVDEAGNRTEALQAAMREQPDIILLDLQLRDERGADMLQELFTAAPLARVIVLTGATDLAAHRDAVRLGAMGVVLKDQAVDVLPKAIERVHAGEVWLNSSLISSMLNEFARSERAPTPDPEAARIRSLTAREREVIALVGEGLKNKQIAQRLIISEATVSHHLTSIFAKLGVGGRFDLVIYAFRHNLIQQPQEWQVASSRQR